MVLPPIILLTLYTIAATPLEMSQQQIFELR
jgi:hypothetical protein